MKKTNLILQTKLEPPRVKGTILRRDRLLAILHDNLDKKLILLCADAGYGKTTLLAQFCEEVSIPFVYYDLDDTDSNMAAFFSYLVAGIRKHYPRFGKAVEELIPETGNVDIVVGTFINEFIKAIKKDFYIILDDFHYLQNNRRICSAIDYLLRHLPKNLHLIISSRAVPNINLTYYLAKQELFEIEKEHLRFNQEEIHSLLSTVYGLKVPDEDVKRIAEFSEGWVTVLQLILQRIRSAGEDAAEDTLNSYAASDENIFNYFAREVFDQTPKRVKEFLLRTAVLDYLNPRVCDYLLNIRRSKKIIDYLDSENIFISKVGDNYQYHPIFHEFLRKKLGQYFASGVVKKLHYKAGVHLLNQSDYAAAVKHFVAAERYAGAARILDQNHQHWMRRADYATFIQLVDSFPDAVLEKYPCLLLRKADALDNLDKKTQALRLTESTLKLFRKKKDKRGTAQALILKALIFYSQGQRRKGIYHANKAYGLIQKRDSLLKADILMQLGSMYRDACRYGKAHACYQSALKILRKFEDREMEESLLTSIALLHFTMSNFKEADRLFMEILSRFSDLLSGLDLLYKYSTVVVVNIDAGDYKKAWDYLARAEEMLLKYNDPWITKYLVYMRGKLHWSEGRFRKAIEFLSEAVEKYKTFSRILDPYILGDIVDSHLRLGEVAKAREVFSKIDSLLDIINETPNLLVDYLTIRGSLETIEGKLDEALASLKDALRKARSIDNPYISVTTYYKLSTTYLKQGSYEQALSSFKKCLDIARQKGYDAYLLIEARENVDLFRLALENDCMVEYVLHILESVDTEQSKDVLNWMQIERGLYDLQCRFFGTLEIRDAQDRIIRPNWRTKNTEELFILFVAGEKKKYSKDELIDTFWPRKDLRGAAHSLHVEISALRNMLKEILRSEFDKQRIVVFVNQHYYLNPKVYVSTDVQKFRQLISQASACVSQNRTRAKQLWMQALDLYRGDFCEHIDAEWCEDIRSYYRKTVVDVLKKMGRVSFEDKSYQESLDFLGRALGIDDTDEAVHISVMRCLQAVNDKDGVQKQYKKLVKALNRMGISLPSSEAKEIYQASLR
ncbi:MAG: tetratricopeptide repeat protein [candidate division WOR-3 bacterium]|jgi:ATP/maltotriose-dependent transcriptional regulator MalT/two-component SAPR family response regulator